MKRQPTPFKKVMTVILTVAMVANMVPTSAIAEAASEWQAAAVGGRRAVRGWSATSPLKGR